ncbi:protein ANTAGONIST OF LIKE HETEROCHROMATIN PROTEIN 1-like [Helianthus annuus]|uniref:protein ANTAGONIST OF LIKE HETEROCHROMATIN PROTEIN 1-like n=1 Tax=Helianthus annuus TaxID=4232 RepID=UPI000B8F0FAA|nr:protein ANTAGONIST OF LIKE HETEROCHROMATIN PROTEIN 1-like [Helianthus annuus]
MADELPPLWFPPMSSDDSSDSSILFFQNLIEEAELQDTGTSNRRRYIERQREEGHETLMADYFVEDPKYNEDIFRHRFRMSKHLFLQIVSDVEENDPWFVEAPDAREFLRRPTSHDMALLYQAHEEKHHLPEYRGQYMRGDHRYPNIMLEAVASQDLWFWHAFAGPPGSQNDINVLQQSPLFLTERNGTAPKCPFYVNNHLYKRGYLLVDGIYPSWFVFVKSIPYPHEVNEKKFKRQHEAARKDVKRAFGVLKGKWGVLSRPMRARSVKKIRNVVYTCIILHNMILKDDGKAIAPVHIRDPPVEPALDDTVLGELLNEDTHWRLKHDLIDHLASQDLPHLLADSDED